MAIASILTTLISIAFPTAPEWVSVFVGAVVPAVFEIVDELSESDLKGPEKFQLAVREVAIALDISFDSLPEWRDLDEDARDRIILGLVELAVFIQKLSRKLGKRGARRATRRLVADFKSRV